LHPLTYFEEEYNNLQIAITDIDTCLLSAKDLHQKLSKTLQYLKHHTKLSTEEYAELVQKMKEVLDSSKDFVDNYSSIFSSIKKMAGDFSEQS